MRFVNEYCCQTEPNVWQHPEKEPPCAVCPKRDLTLTEHNHICMAAFRHLDQTGRETGWQVGYLREEAIDVYLRRYDINTPEIYETILYIDQEITSHRQEKSELKTKRKPNG
jgi:hypothetical protein